jgi:hypothetical protein
VSTEVETLMVFGHPAHELALFGAIQRMRPHILIVTEGGGAERVEYSRKALGELGLLDRTRYLNFRERDFYHALLDRDTRYFDAVIARIREEIARVEPRRVFCDAVEYYNPVHDITLILLRAALARGPEVDRRPWPIAAPCSS